MRGRAVRRLRRLAWLVAFWAGGVLALAAAVGLMRLVMRLAGLDYG